ncbi:MULTISPECIES: adenosylcobinamide-GDP ribazoletransferase [Vibrio]|uniref:Adenosylcobinamide-GDP ribazoletransferase n=1 Tax=Vibrio halioticoli NBRC 102217 TaxID=1219072 RepID=V5F667_9VIBR|nr:MULTISPECIES: adenosylcobinamide-GDP ribazoletransferase [Vibrio]MPW37633.1 adenosylcobinamide-GDP ribazoletransferase [Vibrio sp. B1Z05]GAD91179.1 cobalamin synthase [Vibrio halioticoli NBRC 102217]
MSVISNKYRQLNLLLVAVSFFTRVPVPHWVDYGEDHLNRASRYFGAVGVLVGGVSALVFYLAQLSLPASVAIILAMIASALLTGCFHEDGLADTADGLGGGWSVEKKLSIMKDSRLGTYGALTLMLGLFLKWQLLVELSVFGPAAVCSILVCSHVLSRVVASSMIFSEKYVQDTDASKVKPLANEQQPKDLYILLFTGCLALFGFHGMLALTLVISLFCVRYALCLFFKRQIGGYTGDTLGATQQITEIICYIIILSVGFS